MIYTEKKYFDIYNFVYVIHSFKSVKFHAEYFGNLIKCFKSILK